MGVVSDQVDKRRNYGLRIWIVPLLEGAQAFLWLGPEPIGGRRDSELSSRQLRMNENIIVK